MKLTLQLLAIALCFFIAGSAVAQDQFMPTFEGYSQKKITYITMDNGDEIEVNLKKFKFQKGQIDELKYKTMDNEKVKVEVDQIQSMYVPASALGKFLEGVDALHHHKNWGDERLSSDLFTKGYYYFEKAPTRVKKKTFDTMNQLLNPFTSKKIRVYPDYRSGETMGIGIAGVTVAGGIAKSYYIRVGDKVAYKIKKADYKEQFKIIFKDCPEFVKKHKDNIRWADFAMHIREYTEMCHSEE